MMIIASIIDEADFKGCRSRSDDRWFAWQTRGKSELHRAGWSL